MSDYSSDANTFGRVRSVLWPIHRSELKKFLPMFLIFFFITFNYNVLRTMKDTLVVTARSSGAEVIPFIKVWVMFPGAILMTWLFARLSNRFSREAVFYMMISIFVGYFFLFAFFLYPNRDALHPHYLADSMQTVLPAGCKGLIAMIRNWTFTLFYVASELWGNIILFVLCWGFANQVTRLHEAKRFYGLFGFGGNISGIVAGQASVFLTRKAFDSAIPFGKNGWEQSMMLLLSLVVISGIISMGLFYWMNRLIPKDSAPSDSMAVHEKKPREKLSVRESFSHLFQSQYMRYITVIVIAYNVIINLVEVIWKDQLKMLYPDPSDFNIYFNQVSTIIGIVATFAALFVSGNIIRKYGWTITAMLTPIIMGITSLAFFGIFFAKDSLDQGALMALSGMTPLSLIVLVGSLQNIFSRGAKYTVFDASKEMAFVPLSMASKLKGKAAIDGICNRFGKSGGSMIHQSLLVLFSSFAASSPYVALILFSILGFWMATVRKLGAQFNTLTGVDEAPGSKQEPVIDIPPVSEGEPKLAGTPAF